MKWTDIDFNPPDNVLRQFAAACLVVLAGFGFHQWLVRGNARAAVVLAVAGVLVGVTGWLWPRAVRRLFVASSVAAFPIGWVISQVMLALLFIAVITPVALLFKLRGRDRLSRTRRTGIESYWKPKTTPQDVRRYLRQY